MLCNQCGSQIPDDSNACPNCGAPTNANQNNTQGQQFGQGQPFGQGQQFNQGQPFGQGQPYGQQGGFRAPIAQKNIATWIILSIVTCGICGIIWYINMVDDVNAASQEPNATSGVVVFFLGLVTCNIYNLYWMYKAGEQLNRAKAQRGMMADQNSGLIYLLLTMFGLGIVAYALIQNELNKMATC